ncbi:MAG TPA: hypothetical protein VJ853_14120 [Thermoanaerobaculia bacterium]|nr:hypothetical protein [Thermoanaerobaculia bacterium]
MLSRWMVVLTLFTSIALAAPPPKHIAPETVAHPTALFLASLSGDGHDEVTFKAAAMGTHFFFEEPGGVTVYDFDGRTYRRERFLKGATLAKAIKQFAKLGH